MASNKKFQIRVQEDYAIKYKFVTDCGRMTNDEAQQRLTQLQERHLELMATNERYAALFNTLPTVMLKSSIPLNDKVVSIACSVLNYTLKQEVLCKRWEKETEAKRKKSVARSRLARQAKKDAEIAAEQERIRQSGKL